MPQQIGWSVESKLLYEIKQLTRQLSGRQYILTFPNFASFPTPGITGTLYVDESTGDIYVWNGTAYTLLSAGITALNGLIAAAQLLVTGSTGTDFNISSVGTTHTFNIPTASATNRGLLSSANWTTFNNKQNAITLTTTGTSGAATLVGSTLNIPQYQSVLTNPVTGTGTTNYVPKFTAASTIGNSQIFDNGTNVGLGTASPGYRLTVAGASTAGSVTALAVENPSTNAASEVRQEFRAGGSTWGYITNGYNSNSPFMAFGVSASSAAPTERLRITSGGNIGIGTASPTGAGERYINLFGAGNSELHFTNNTSGTTSSDGLSLAYSGNDMYFFNFESGFMSFGTSNAERLRITSGGDVGIGTASPNEKLEVFGGNLRIAKSSGEVAFVLRTGTNEFYGVNNASLYGLYSNDYGSLFVRDKASGYLNIYDKMRITSGGDVGIGTTSPTQKIHVSSASNTAILAQSTTTFPLFVLTNNNGVSWNIEGGRTSNSFGIYQSAGAGGGTTYFNIRENGRVGVNTTTDAGYQFDVNGSMRTTNGAQFGTTSGNVGIGTTTPQVKLVVSNGGNLGLEIDPTNTSGTVLNMFAYDRVAAVYRTLALNSGGGDVAIGSTSASYKLDINGTLRSVNGANFATTSGNVGIGTASPTNAKLVVEGSSAGTIGAIMSTDVASTTSFLRMVGDVGSQNLINWQTGTALRFATSTQAYGTFAEHARINSNGELLINTTSDAGDYKLQVAGNIYASGLAKIGDVLTNTNAPFVTGGNIYTNGQSLAVGTQSANFFGFFTNNTQRAYISSAGEFIIDASASDAGDYKLQVVGNQYLSGKLVVGTTTDNGKKLQVQGDVKVTGGAFIVNDTGTGDGLTIRHDGSNNMSINQNNNALLNISTGGPSGDIVFNPASVGRFRVIASGGVRIIPQATVPTAQAGALYYDSATNKLKLYDGTSWVDLN